MTISASEYAAMAYAAYGFIEGKDPLTKLSGFDPRLDKSSYRVLVAKNEYTVFSKISTGEVVCAIKGTSTAGDWASNSLIAVGALGSDPRIRELINVVRRYKKDGVDISVTGHSLGGALATALAKREDVLAVTFNTGSFLAESTVTAKANSAALGEKSENVVQFNTGTDVLSFTGAHINPMSGSATFFVDSTQSSAHSMKNFQGLDDTTYQTDIDTRATSTRKFRSENPNTRVEEYTRKDQVEQVVNDAKNLIAKFREIKGYYDTAKALAKSRGNIPENLMTKWNSFKTDVNSVYRSLKRLNQARIDRDLQGAMDAGEELVTNVNSLRQHGTFDRFIKDMSREGGAGDGSLGDALASVESVDSPLDMEFDGFEEMEVYDVGDGLDPLDDGEGLGFDDEVADLDAIEEGEVEVLDVVEEDVMAGLGESESFLVEDGALEVVNLASSEVRTMVMSMSRVASIVGGVLAIVGVIVVVVLEIIQSGEKQRRLHQEEVKIKNIVAEFGSKFRHMCHKIHIPIPQNNRNPVVGTVQQTFITKHVSYPWSDYDLYGDSIFTYLEYRLKNPQVFFPGDELDVLSRLHMKYFSPGVPFCLPRDGIGKQMTLNANLFKGELDELSSSIPFSGKPNALKAALTGTFDESSFLLIYNAFSRYRVKRNKKSYTVELERFFAQHKKHSFLDMSDSFQTEWTQRLYRIVKPSVRRYINECFGMVNFMMFMEDGANFTRSSTKADLLAAGQSLRAYLVSFVITHHDPFTANNRLVEFEKTHSVAAFHRGLEELTTVYGMDTWLYNKGRDLTHFSTIFDLGSLKILTGPIRSLAEQRSMQKLIEHEIKKSNLGFDAFYAAGNPGQGDNETADEFYERVTRWVGEWARAERVAVSSGRDYRKPDGGVVYTVSRGVDGMGPGDPPVSGAPATQSVPAVLDAAAVVCAWRPSKKSKVGPLI